MTVQIGHFRIEREVARRGYGTVYVAQDTRLERTVTLKILSATAGGSNGTQLSSS